MEKIHHSVADWELEENHAYFLDNEQFLSGPTSLCCPAVNREVTLRYVYLKPALGLNIPEGMVDIYKLFTTFHLTWEFYFRQQTPLVHRGNQNGYVITFSDNTRKATIRQYVNGIETSLGTIEYTNFSSYWWQGFRIEWYGYLSAYFEPILRIRISQRLSGEWVVQGFVDDAANAFAESGVNRVGFALYGQLESRRVWTDDTSVYRKKET